MILFTNRHWNNRVLNPNCFSSFYANGYLEYIAAHCMLHPIRDHVASENKFVFDPKKAAAMYFWYEAADAEDKSIIGYFPEYETCIDMHHKKFNSNYGLYAKEGISRCINELLSKKSSRQACFLINNNVAMGPDSIDKLCTNAIMFLIRNDFLYMNVQMRSSNMLTLLPYDFFIFSTWYAKVYNALIKEYPNLHVTEISVSISSLHKYDSDQYAKSNCPVNTHLDQIFSYDDMCNHNFKNILEEKLFNFLKD